MVDGKKKTRPATLAIHIVICLVTFGVYACGGSSGSNDRKSQDGAMDFALRFADQAPAADINAAEFASGDVCADFGIVLIAADIVDSNNSIVASDSWPCTDRQGNFEDIPAGSGYSLIVEGIVETGDADWRGVKSDITVNGGETTDVGLVILFFVGDDDTLPTVVSTDPVDGEICVAADRVVSAQFSERINPATLNENTFTLSGGADALSGAVSYDPADLTAKFTPDDPLSFGEAYTATLSETIEDLAGNQMAGDMTWSFTTVLISDYDSDCDVDGQDLSTFAAAYASGSLQADLNQDGLVNADDIDVFTEDYGFDGNDDT